MLEAIRHGASRGGDLHRDAIERVNLHTLCESLRLAGANHVQRWIIDAWCARVLTQKNRDRMRLVASDLMKIESAHKYDDRLRNPRRHLGKRQMFIPRSVWQTIEPAGHLLQRTAAQRPRESHT